MSWLWGEKKKQEDIPMEYDSNTREENIIHRTLKVHLEIQMEYPSNKDVIKILRDLNPSFSLPPGTAINDMKMSHVEILGDPNVGK